MSGKFVVGYDGSEAAGRALDFAIERAAAQGGSVLIAHVLEWSPYSFLTPTELEERHKRRTEELERAQAALAPVVKGASDKGAEISTEIRYGNIGEMLCTIASEANATQIFIGRNGHSTFGSRIFGSVAGALVQTAPVPCTIVP